MKIIQTELTEEEIMQLYNFYFQEVEKKKGRDRTKKHKRITEFLSCLHPIKSKQREIIS